MRALFVANLGQDTPEWWLCVATKRNAMRIFPFDRCDTGWVEADLNDMLRLNSSTQCSRGSWPFDADATADIARHLGVTADRLPGRCWVMEE